MKFSVKREELVGAVSLVSKSLSTKTNLPILSNILVNVKKGKVEVVTTNLESASRVSLVAKVEKEGETTLLGKTLVEFVTQLEGESVDFEKLGEEILITCGEVAARFATIEASEFPEIPKILAARQIKLKGSDLAAVISKVAFCAAQDESRPILTGVLVRIEKNKLSMIATDGYRLGYCEGAVGAEGGVGPLSIVVPAKALIEVSKIISEVDRENLEVEFKIADNLNQAVFVVGNVEYTSRLIEGEFPNWQKIIPTAFATSAKVKREDFLKAVRVASIFARDSGNIVKVKVEGGKGEAGTITLSATTAQVGSANASADAKIEGAGGEIAFNFRYIVEALSAFSDEIVSFEMNESLNPGRLVGEKDGKGFFHIIMPVRLQS